MKVTYAMPAKPTAPAGESVPRVARLLALAHKFQGMLDRGEVESIAELARLGRVSRARITQILRSANGREERRGVQRRHPEGALGLPMRPTRFGPHERSC
jgi:hypothetical protein